MWQVNRVRSFTIKLLLKVRRLKIWWCEIAGMVHICRKLRRYPSLRHNYRRTWRERHIRSRHDSRNDEDTHCVFLQRKKPPLHLCVISSTGDKWTVSVRNGGDARIGWHDRRKYLQVCTSYHEGGKDGSSIHDVAAAPYKLQEHRCISEIDTLSQGVDDAINLWEAGFDSWSLCRLRSGFVNAGGREQALFEVLSKISTR